MTTYYDTNFKIYYASTPDAWSETTADTHKINRALILGGAYYFSGGTYIRPINEAFVKSTLFSLTTNWYPDRTRNPTIDIGSGSDPIGNDYPPIFINLETKDGITFEPFWPHVTTDDAAYEVCAEIYKAIDLTARAFPNRQISWYGGSPDSDWYALKEWWEVENQPTSSNKTSKLNWYLRWRRENERMLRSVRTQSGDFKGALELAHISSPWAYLPTNTSFAAGQNWYQHADAILWERYFRELTSESKRLYSKPCIPWIQFYKPETSNYINHAWTRRQMDVALTDPNCDGVVIYHPSSVSTSAWRFELQAWVEETLGDVIS